MSKQCKACNELILDAKRATKYCEKCGPIIKAEKMKAYKKANADKHRKYMCVYMANIRKT